ncbi:hypothetical protein GCM10022225_04720 [Plantactinospora mayteni]|uniref:Uncharacterized protein n=1 Tax=Plantactinospora mayteni TaxID=566021 RepID=A0ABQ4EQL6_9ACTN|nr:hypothetical protein [Plantactinospora mayteni]GIG96961.1 hypothetical protein Pma05_35340 [Plantactinospora mayteni]
MARILGRKAILLVVGALALTLVGGGIAVAGPSHRTDPDAVQINGKVVQQPPVTQADIDLAKAALLKGDASVQASSAQLFAVVSANGGLIRGSQAVSATSLGLGLYQVVFSVPVATGAFVGAIGLTGSVGTSPSGLISVVGRTNLAQGVFVQTWNAANVPANRSFHLSVFLP